jgi:hypothetical protein
MATTHPSVSPPSALWRDCLLAFGAALYVTSWFVVTYGDLGNPGWVAFFQAVGYNNELPSYLGKLSEAGRLVLYGPSADTNLLALAWGLAYVKPAGRFVAAVGWASLAAFMLNLVWIVAAQKDNQIAPLHVGYYAWLLSFLVMGVATLLSARAAAESRGEARP